MIYNFSWYIHSKYCLLRLRCIDNMTNNIGLKFLSKSLYIYIYIVKRKFQTYLLIQIFADLLSSL